jgi:hypothetical protein
MKTEEIIGVTLNISILAVFYTVIGGFISYFLEFFVEPHTPEWEKKSLLYKFGDVSIQLAIVGSLAFWVTYVIREAAPIFPVSRELDHMVDTYASGLFFAYAMFLFLDFLDTKIKFLYHHTLDKHVEKMFPSRKTDKKKTTSLNTHGLQT